ncbi:MAG: hypothetical protein KAH46_24200 [Mycobacterium sp.]|nr:hypothetical protein [Mycobacterium sp.]
MKPGVYSRAELGAMGVGNNLLRAKVRAEELVSVRHGWYRTAGADGDVVEAVRRGDALSCVSVLARAGVWIPEGYGGVHVRAARHLRDSRTGRFCRGHGAPWPVTTAVDTPLDALVCAAQCVSDEDWLILCDSVMNQSGRSVEDLVALLRPLSRRSLALMEKCDGRSQSGTETAVRVRLRARGFHVDVQPKVPTVGQVDLRVGKLLIECDSRKHHTGADTYQEDRRRDRAALLRGDLSMRLTYQDVFHSWNTTEQEIVALTRPRRHRDRRAS